jgi:hypothetical protein
MMGLANKNFIVLFKSGDTQPLIAASSCIDGECLIFQGLEDELVAFFDLREVADWGPKLSEQELS